MTEEKEWWEIEEEESGDEWWNITTHEHSDWWVITTESDSDWWKMEADGEEGEWVTGKAGTLEIQWYELLEWFPVEQEAELVQTIVEPRTKNHPDGGFFDGFSLKYSLLFDKLFGPERVDICLEETSDNKEIPLFGAPDNSKIKAVYILPESSITGDDTNYMILKLRNKETGGDICTKHYITGNNVIAHELDLFGPPAEAHSLVQSMKSASLIVEKVGTGFTLPRSVVIILWDVAG